MCHWGKYAILVALGRCYGAPLTRIVSNWFSLTGDSRWLPNPPSKWRVSRSLDTFALRTCSSCLSTVLRCGQHEVYRTGGLYSVLPNQAYRVCCELLRLAEGDFVVSAHSCCCMLLVAGRAGSWRVLAGAGRCRPMVADGGQCVVEAVQCNVNLYVHCQLAMKAEVRRCCLSRSGTLTPLSHLSPVFFPLLFIERWGRTILHGKKLGCDKETNENSDTDYPIVNCSPSPLRGAGHRASTLSQ